MKSKLLWGGLSLLATAIGVLLTELLEPRSKAHAAHQQYRESHRQLSYMALEQ